ncbi:hypothetical protein PR048_005911 [Dryococelus australis]|uniref:Uncharacterized protein n=1 Tax=Dryococelus australis TaxID=614101 RepID=A0ABQ9IAP3_9NEOP|nr:hypothetical protein PR048_005911 [Dryococelus australis]
MRVIEVSMEQRRNERAGTTGDRKKTHRPTVLSGTIPTCENPVTQPGIEPGSPLGGGEQTNCSATVAPLIKWPISARCLNIAVPDCRLVEGDIVVGLLLQYAVVINLASWFTEVVMLGSYEDSNLGLFHTIITSPPMFTCKVSSPRLGVSRGREMEIAVSLEKCCCARDMLRSVCTEAGRVLNLKCCCNWHTVLGKFGTHVLHRQGRDSQYTRVHCQIAPSYRILSRLGTKHKEKAHLNGPPLRQGLKGEVVSRETKIFDHPGCKCSFNCVKDVDKLPTHKRSRNGYALGITPIPQTWTAGLYNVSPWRRLPGGCYVPTLCRPRTSLLLHSENMLIQQFLNVLRYLLPMDHRTLFIISQNFENDVMDYNIPPELRGKVDQPSRMCAQMIILGDAGEMWHLLGAAGAASNWTVRVEFIARQSPHSHSPPTPATLDDLRFGYVTRRDFELTIEKAWKKQVLRDFRIFVYTFFLGNYEDRENQAPGDRHSGEAIERGSPLTQCLGRDSLHRPRIKRTPHPGVAEAQHHHPLQGAREREGERERKPDVDNYCRTGALNMTSVERSGDVSVTPPVLNRNSLHFPVISFLFLFVTDLPWRSRLVRRRSGVREALGSNPKKHVGRGLTSAHVTVNSLYVLCHGACCSLEAGRQAPARTTARLVTLAGARRTAKWPGSDAAFPPGDATSPSILSISGDTESELTGKCRYKSHPAPFHCSSCANTSSALLAAASLSFLHAPALREVPLLVVCPCYRLT